jgi:hypothetical protein
MAKSASRQDNLKDNFSVPPSLNDRYEVPHRLDRRWGLGDTKDLTQICEMGFAKSMRLLGKEILEDVRQELSVIGVFRKEVGESLKLMEEYQKGVDCKMTDMHGRVMNLEEEMQKPANLANFDYNSIYEEIRNADILRNAAHEQMFEHLEEHMTTNVTQVGDDVRSLILKQEQAEEVFFTHIQQDLQAVRSRTIDVTELVRQTRLQVDEVVSLQQSLCANSAETHSSVQMIQKAHMQLPDNLAPCLTVHLSKLLVEQAVRIDWSYMETNLQTVMKNGTANATQMLYEMSKIQQALNVDFAQVLVGIGEITSKPEEVAEKTPKNGVKKMATLKNAPKIDIISEEELAEGGDGGKMASLRPKRVREYWTQTDSSDHMRDGQTQTTEVFQTKGEGSQSRRKKPKPRKSQAGTQEDGNGRKPKAVFADKDSLKKKLRVALLKPQYNVFDYYYQTGKAQAIARSTIFEHLTFLVIGVNSLWIAVDTDHNDATVLIEADLVFILVENAFCGYFTGELLTRFFAFQFKWRALRDFWFMFDSCLVSMMVIETWVISIIMLCIGDAGTANMGDTLILRMVRMIKMLRISRMARLLRAIPELVILIKGIGAAARSVAIFVIFWGFLIYIFAVAFRQMTNNTSLGIQYFQSVPHAMNTLLLRGILPDHTQFVYDVAAGSPFFWFLIMCFILLAAVTLMYMLIGVLVEVVGAIASTEKEGMTVTSVAQQMREVMANLDKDTETAMSRMQFQDLLCENEMAIILHDVGVDPVALLEMSDVIYESVDKDGCGMMFESFIDVVLNMRGTNPATVKDMKQSLLVMKALLKDATQDLKDALRKDLEKMNGQLLEIKETREEREADDDDDEDDEHYPSQDLHKQRHSLK